jgi:hypothetical protein
VHQKRLLGAMIQIIAATGYLKYSGKEGQEPTVITFHRQSGLYKQSAKFRFMFLYLSFGLV